MKPTTLLDTVTAIVGGVALAAALLAVGLLACTLPVTTRALSNATSLEDISPYNKGQIVDMACATQAYTAYPYAVSGGEEKATQAIVSLNAALVREGMANPKNTSDWTRVSAVAKLAERESSNLGESSEAADQRLVKAVAAIDTRFVLGEDEISHLKDCNRVIWLFAPWLIGACAIALAALTILHFRNFHRPNAATLCARMCTAAPALLVGVFAILGVWAMADFRGFFGTFHALLFPQGNWQFPYDSLLIVMLPEDFWVGMGAVWLVTTVIASIICLLFAAFLRRTARKRAAAN